MLACVSQRKLDSGSRNADAVLQATSPSQSRAQPVGISGTPQDQHQGEHLGITSSTALDRQASTSLRVRTPDPRDRIDLCRKVKILATVEKSPVRTRKTGRAIPGLSPHDTSSDYVPTHSESSDEPSGTAENLQRPGNLWGYVPGLAVAPVVKIESQDVPDGRSRKLTTSSDVPPEFLCLDQKHPHMKANRSRLRKQLRELNLNGLVESNQATHTTDVIKGLKDRLKKYEELARQIKALQGEKLLSCNGKLFTLGKQLGLVRDARCSSDATGVLWV